MGGVPWSGVLQIWLWCDVLMARWRGCYRKRLCQCCSSGACECG